MRDIKFRGKVGNDWVYGSLITKKSNGETVYLIFDGKANHKVDPETVGQLTGLKDKNGKEVFEGDLVNASWNIHGKPSDIVSRAYIRYNDAVGAWQIAYMNMDDNIVWDNIGFRYFIEVIGNIHDNPQLLTQNSEQ